MPDTTSSKRLTGATPPANRAVTATGTPAVLRDALRELRIELAIATRRVAAVTGLRESDLDVLDVLARQGAQSPTALARRMGIHPATMTGVLTRLEKAGWVLRRRDVTDRRSVHVESACFDRLANLYSDGNERLDQIADQLTAKDAAIICDYLNKACEAVHDAASRLAVGEPNS